MSSIRGPFAHLHAAWIVAVGAAQLATYPAYVLAYRSVGRLVDRPQPGLSTIVRVVVAGFGPVAVSGGFGLDRTALRALDEDETAVQTRVGAMSTIEWAVLAPATWVVAVVLLATGAHVSGALLWPWALGVPAGLIAAVAVTRPGRAERLARRLARRHAVPTRLLGGIRSVRGMARRPRRYAGAWIGTTLYWCAEICALHAAVRAVGLHLDLELSVLAYATGYLASRRSLPLGGAGVTEVLLVYSLTQLHQPLGPAIDAVMIYRLFNFLVMIVPALIAYRGLRPATPRR